MSRRRWKCSIGSCVLWRNTRLRKRPRSARFTPGRGNFPYIVAYPDEALNTLGLGSISPIWAAPFLLQRSGYSQFWLPSPLLLEYSHQLLESLCMDTRPLSVIDARAPDEPRPTREQAESAVRTLLRWAGDDPNREGLRDTPARVARAYEDWFSGYADDPVIFLQRTFEEVEGYDEMVMLRDIRFESHCEHHLAPIIGRAHVGYLPARKIVGISKLARVVDAYARRLQVQEKMNAQIANCIQQVLEPKGVAVVIEAAHQCMTTRGVHKPGLTMVTSTMLVPFREHSRTRCEFLAMIRNPESIVG